MFELIRVPFGKTLDSQISDFGSHFAQIDMSAVRNSIAAHSTLPAIRMLARWATAWEPERNAGIGRLTIHEEHVVPFVAQFSERRRLMGTAY